jgi:hypothetical protein
MILYFLQTSRIIQIASFDLLTLIELVLFNHRARVMSRQVSFYMTAENEKNLQHDILLMGDVVFLPNLLITGKESFKKFSDFENTKNFSPNVCYLWNRSISPTPILNYCKEQKCYFPDFLQSEIISYRRPKCEKINYSWDGFLLSKMLPLKKAI